MKSIIFKKTPVGKIVSEHWDTSELIKKDELIKHKTDLIAKWKGEIKDIFIEWDKTGNDNLIVKRLLVEVKIQHEKDEIKLLEEKRSERNKLKRKPVN